MSAPAYSLEGPSTACVRAALRVALKSLEHYKARIAQEAERGRDHRSNEERPELGASVCAPDLCGGVRAGDRGAAKVAAEVMA